MDTLKGAAESSSRKIFSPSVSRNREHILAVLKERLGKLARPDEPLGLVELACGTGEHASMLAENIPKLQVLPVEPDANMLHSIAAFAEEDGAKGRIAERKSFVLPPLNISVEQLGKSSLPASFAPIVKAMLCVNMIHISPYSSTEELFRAGSEILPDCGQIFTYGPYSDGGQMAPSNAEFDKRLKERNAAWGVRDITTLAKTAETHGFFLEEKTGMPANNLLLTFTKGEGN